MPVRRRLLGKAPLRYTLALGFGLFGAALTFALSGVLENFASRQLRTQIDAELASTASQMRDKLDRGMFERFRDIQIAASLIDVFSPEAPRNAQRAWLETLQATFPDYAWIGFTDASGKVLSATGGLLEGADVSSRPWYRDAQAAPTVGDVHDAKLLQKLLAGPGAEPLRFVDASAPVFSRDGRLNGVLGAHVSWSWAKEIRASVLAEGGSSRGVELLVYSREGALLLGSNGATAPDAIKVSGAAADLTPLSDGFIVRESLSQGYRSFDGLGWRVVARQPVASALAPVTSLRREVLMIGLGMIVAFMAIGWIAANALARPLERLASWATDLGGGSAGVPPPSVDVCREATVLGETLTSAFSALSRGNAELEALNATLERQVEDRTRALADAKDEALFAARAKSDFLATMSHELRTPLHGIAGATQMLRDEGGLTATQERRLGLIETASSALLRVIGDVLDFSKLEAGKLEIDPAPFNVRALVEASALIVEPTALAKGLTTSFKLAPGIPERLVGDEPRLRQVLLNLLNNAIKFSSQGAIAVSVALETLAGGEATLRFSVSDQGVGISPETRRRLFNRFTQADASTSRKHGGAGLGLAISRHLVEAMGGRIDVDSKPGEGSTFWFVVSLPMAAAVPTAVAQPEPGAAEAGKRVLLAEDIALNQEIAVAFLASAGHHVEVAANGAEAIEAVRRRAFDLVLMDIQMPVMDGVEAIEAIRRLPGAERDVTVIAMTANVFADELARFAAAGFDGHIGKPFGRDELIRSVAQAARAA